MNIIFYYFYYVYLVNKIKNKIVYIVEIVFYFVDKLVIRMWLFIFIYMRYVLFN